MIRSQAGEYCPTLWTKSLRMEEKEVLTFVMGKAKAVPLNPFHT